jgi:Ca2+-transporting ATPase
MESPPVLDHVAVHVKHGDKNHQELTLGATPYALMVGHKNAAELQSRGGVSGVLAALGSDRLRGVPLASLASRKQRYGVNKLPEEEVKSFVDFVKESLEDRTLQVLIGAAVVSLILGMTTQDPRTGEVDRSTGWIEGAAILLSVVIVTIVSAINNHQKQLQFRALSAAETIAPVVVVRDGEVVEIPNDEVLVGDIVLVMAGMALSFDALLVDGTGFSANESSITGENDDVNKASDGDAFLISGTHIVDGCDGLAVVVAVGQTSYAGAIAMATRQEKKETPLQEQLTGLADIIGRFGLGAAVFTFVVLSLKELYFIFVGGGKFYSMKFFENLTTAVAIVVVAVPEGLPLSVTLSLAYSMKQMLADQNLVRHLAACETMGGATCICSDKTGTLTTNDMKPVAFYADERRFAVPLDAREPIALQQAPSDPPLSASRRLVLERMAESIAYNYPNTFGNKTAMALQQLALQLVAATGYDAVAAVGNIERAHIQRFAFSSQRKRSSVVVHQTVHSPATAGGKPSVTSSHLHYVIGAAELVFQKCTSSLVDGRRTLLSIEAKARYEAVMSEYMQLGYRTLCLAFSEKSGEFSGLPHVPPEDPLCILAVVGIEEPLRPEVPSAIAACKGAGIRVRMVTGDSVVTAVNIATRCGIMSDDTIVVDGSTFRAQSDEELAVNVIPRLAVLARATPLDKQRLVELIQRASPDAVVAVTGDGTNDAPALKAATVGFAMNTGSDIAKQACDIVLLDDNFVGVVKAVVWGRNVRDNIRKFLQFQLTVNTVACIVAFVGAVMNTQNLSPLKPVQLLWLNLIMDTFAALALATELPNEAALLRRTPDPRTASIITKEMVHNIAVQAIFQLMTEIVLLGCIHTSLGVEYFGNVHLTVAFNTFVLLQVFNFFNARLLHADSSVLSNLGKSHGMLYIIFVILVLQIAIVQKGGKFMSTVALDGRQWLLCFVIASLSLPVGYIGRATAPRQGRRGLSWIGDAIGALVSRCPGIPLAAAPHAAGAKVAGKE